MTGDRVTARSSMTVLRRAAMVLAGSVLTLGSACGVWAGYLRLTGNIHEIEPGVYRTGQLSADTLSALIHHDGIRTVLNLRGDNPGKGWFDAEARAVRAAGADLVSIPLSANHEPDAATLGRLVSSLETSPRPLLIHCEAGADRSGLAAALYEIVVAHRTANVARGQLSFLYGHFPWLVSRSGAMDRTFARFVPDAGAAAGASKDSAPLKAK